MQGNAHAVSWLIQSSHQGYFTRSPGPRLTVKVGVLHLIRRHSPTQLYEYVEMKLQITYLPFGGSRKTQRSRHSSGLLPIVIGRNTRCVLTLWTIDEKHYPGSTDEHRRSIARASINATYAYGNNADWGEKSDLFRVLFCYCKPEVTHTLSSLVSLSCCKR